MIGDEEEVIGGICKLGKFRIGGSGFIEDSNTRVAGNWRAGEFPVDGRLFCRRFDVDLSSSGDPKLKETGAPKLIRLEADRCAELVSLDEEVERDQRLWLTRPSAAGSRRNSGGVKRRWELEEFTRPFGGICGVG